MLTTPRPTTRRQRLRGRLLPVAVAGALVFNGAKMIHPTAADAVTPPPPYPCTTRIDGGVGGVICHGGNARAVLVYRTSAAYLSREYRVLGPCVTPGHTSVAAIPNASYWAGSRVVGLGAASC